MSPNLQIKQICRISSGQLHNIDKNRNILSQRDAELLLKFLSFISALICCHIKNSHTDYFFVNEHTTDSLTFPLDKLHELVTKSAKTAIVFLNFQKASRTSYLCFHRITILISLFQSLIVDAF